ncbi:MAG: hypothetical protein K0R00_3203 [Herbinix sp.]|jgi:hypothetical protein|nr:hypothetical protein [Herbinix sp.]
MKRERIYEIWRLMVGRCHNPNWNNHFTTTYYRNKGITVCDEWRFNFHAFKEWAFNNGYSDLLSIDRVDSNGNYEPSNCRWITLKENRSRARKNNKKSLVKSHKKVGRYEVRFSAINGLFRVVKSKLMYHDARELQRKLTNENKDSIPKGFYYCVVKTERTTIKMQ